jgi:hypothetical protein
MVGAVEAARVLRNVALDFDAPIAGAGIVYAHFRPFFSPRATSRFIEAPHNRTDRSYRFLEFSC